MRLEVHGGLPGLGVEVHCGQLRLVLLTNQRRVLSMLTNQRPPLSVLTNQKPVYLGVVLCHVTSERKHRSPMGSPVHAVDENDKDEDNDDNNYSDNGHLLCSLISFLFLFSSSLRTFFRVRNNWCFSSWRQGNFYGKQITLDNMHDNMHRHSDSGLNIFIRNLN